MSHVETFCRNTKTRDSRAFLTYHGEFSVCRRVRASHSEMGGQGSAILFIFPRTSLPELGILDLLRIALSSSFPSSFESLAHGRSFTYTVDGACVRFAKLLLPCLAKESRGSVRKLSTPPNNIRNHLAMQSKLHTKPVVSLHPSHAPNPSTGAVCLGRGELSLL